MDMKAVYDKMEPDQQEAVGKGLALLRASGFFNQIRRQKAENVLRMVQSASTTLTPEQWAPLKFESIEYAVLVRLTESFEQLLD